MNESIAYTWVQPHATIQIYGQLYASPVDSLAGKIMLFIASIYFKLQTFYVYMVLFAYTGKTKRFILISPPTPRKTAHNHIFLSSLPLHLVIWKSSSLCLHVAKECPLSPGDIIGPIVKHLFCYMRGRVCATFSSIHHKSLNFSTNSAFNKRVTILTILVAHADSLQLQLFQSYGFLQTCYSHHLQYFLLLDQTSLQNIWTSGKKHSTRRGEQVFDTPEIVEYL